MRPVLTSLLSRLAGAAVILMGLTAAPASLAQTQNAQPATPPAEKVQFIKTGLFMIAGDGANTAVRLTGNGIILVDGKLPGHYAAVVGRAHAIADELAVRLLILTGPEEVRTGTNVDFLKAGIPVMAQEHVKAILAERGQSEEPIALPSVTFDQERTLKLGGVTVQVRYFGAARTSGDAVVYFPDRKAVAVGDLYTNSSLEVDESAGGSLKGWAGALRKILQLDFDTVVPGSGPPITRSELELLADRLDKRIAAAGAN